ncbi:unnamed protein product [Closterium sp. NIES-53]
MEVARTSMIHVAAPHFLWPFAIQYAAHQLNLWPRVSLPETSPTLRWTGKVGDASVFRVWGSRAFVCDTSVDKLSARAIPCVDVTFNESVSFYHLFPYRSAPPPPPPLFLAPGPPPVEPLPPQGSAPSGVSQVDPLSGSAPVQVALGSSATPGTASRGATSGGAELGGAGSEGAGSGGAVHPSTGGARGTCGRDCTSFPCFSRFLVSRRLLTGGFIERREPASCPVLPVHTACRAIRSHPPHVPDTHAMALRPSSVPLRVPLPAPLESSLHEVPNRASDHSRATSPTVSHLLATAVTDPSFESASASALLAEMLYFVAACRLDYASALVAEFLSASPPSVRGECALGTDVLEDRREDFECLVAAVPRFTSVLLALEGNPDAQDIPTPCSYAEAITGPYSSKWQGDGILEGVDYFQTFSPTPKMTTLRVLLHIAAQRDYQLHSLDFSTAFLQLRWTFYGLRQAPREWHETLKTTLAALGFAPSTADSSLPPFYVLVYVNDLVFATAVTEALTLVKSELQKRHICTDLGELRSNLGLQITRDRARRTITVTQSHMVHRQSSSMASFVLRTWPLGPTLLMSSPRHFRLVIINALLLC